jgi:hypothetical protein
MGVCARFSHAGAEILAFCLRQGAVRKLALTSGVLWLLRSSAGADSLVELSDEFDRADSLTNWHRVFQTEGWNADQLEIQNVNTAVPGRMLMVPRTSTWYQDYRGELTFKLVSGDFAITTLVHPRNRQNTAAPGRDFSLAGLMLRIPTGLTDGAIGWGLGRENYVFLSLGSADSPGSYQFEVKTTRASVSVLNISPGVPEAAIQLARIGSSVLTLVRPVGGAWRVHRRYSRPDFPNSLQAGLTVYTHWSGVQAVYPFGQERNHNSHVIVGQNPDLRAEFEYVRFHRIVVPENLVGRDFSNPAQVSDPQILALLGETANVPGGAAIPPRFAETRIASSDGTFHTVIDQLQPERSYSIHRRSVQPGGSWEEVTRFVSTSDRRDLYVAPTSSTGPGWLYRVVSP